MTGLSLNTAMRSIRIILIFLAVIVTIMVCFELSTALFAYYKSTTINKGVAVGPTIRQNCLSVDQRLTENRPFNFLPDIPVPASNENFTIIMQTFERLDLLSMIIPSYCNMSRVDRILIVWNNVNMSIPPELNEMPCDRAELIFIPMKTNRVRNRFQPFSEIRTEGNDSVCSATELVK